MDHLHRLRTGTTLVTVSEFGASLRQLRVGGIELVHGGFDVDSPGDAGIVMVPWVNRVADARWAARGEQHVLSVTEPALGHAIHGLLAKERYTVADVGEDALTLSASIDGAPGYPFALATEVEYRAQDDGVAVTHRVSNRGTSPAPVALGAHPYLRIGDTPSRDLEIQISADFALDLDGRHIPGGPRNVTGTAADLRAWTPVDAAERHACLTGLDVADGRVVHRLRSGAGVEVQLWADPAFEFVQLYITDAFPGIGDDSVAVAIEPMTAPPNAFNSHVGLTWIEPGDTRELTWGIRRAS